MSFKKRIVGVIGLGHVGAHVAFNLGVLGIADEVKLCDVNHDKLVSERQDFMDAVMFMPHRVNYTIASYEELAGLRRHRQCHRRHQALRFGQP